MAPRRSSASELSDVEKRRLIESYKRVYETESAEAALAALLELPDGLAVFACPVCHPYPIQLGEIGTWLQPSGMRNHANKHHGGVSHVIQAGARPDDHAGRATLEDAD